MAKTWQQLTPTFTKMSDDAARAADASVLRGTVVLHGLVSANGARFHIRGRSGAKVRLGASRDIRSGKDGPVGAVRGTPQGFWAIVERGSGPHLIVRGGGRGIRAIRQFEAGTLGSGKPPLKFGPNYAQFVNHPGHGALGHPWEQAMTAFPTTLTYVTAKEAAQRMIKSFT